MVCWFAGLLVGWFGGLVVWWFGLQVWFASLVCKFGLQVCRFAGLLVLYLVDFVFKMQDMLVGDRQPHDRQTF